MHKSGTTMIEALIALVILVMCIAPIITTQATRLRGAAYGARLLDRMQQVATMVNLLAYVGKESDSKDGVRQITNPPTKITIMHDEPSEKSSLGAFRGITIIRATMTWQEAGGRYSDEYVTCIYAPSLQDAS